MEKCEPLREGVKKLYRYTVHTYTAFRYGYKVWVVAKSIFVLRTKVCMQYALYTNTLCFKKLLITLTANW